MSYLIGIDIGTSSAKAIVMDRVGRVLAAAGQEYAIRSPQPGWAEQDPEDWFTAVRTTLRLAVQKAGLEADEVAAIGLTGQMHSLAVLNEGGTPLRPAILWADSRSTREVEWVREQLGPEGLARHTGNPVAAGFMLPSWLWLRRHEPETAANARWLVLPKDYVRYRLTGVMGSEPSDASSTALFDPHERQWSAAMLALAGLDERNLPPISESDQITGVLRGGLAAEVGLRPGVPVVMGGSDQSTAALGQGVVAPGTVACTIGTGGQLFAPLKQPLHDPELRLHLFCHCVPHLWHQEAAILTAGLALRWLRDNVWPGSNYQDLAEAAAGAEAASEGLFFLPYLAGERTPHMDPHIRAAWVGLDLRHGRANIVRAVMEGVVFALKQGLELMVSLGAPVQTLIAAGGATRHPLWLQLQADIFNRPVYPAHSADTTAVGAAMLAGIGAGFYRDPASAIESVVRASVQPVLPDPKRVDMYRQAFERFVALYPAVSGKDEN